MVIVKFLVHYYTIQFKKMYYMIFSGETRESKINYLLHSDYLLINEPLICTQAHPKTSNKSIGTRVFCE